MAIGAWGTDVIFETSDKRVLTFNDMNRTVGSEWATHSRIGLKDQVEYLRPTLQKLTFSITLDALHGVRPRSTMEMISDHSEKGSVFPMVVGGRRVGKHKWRITRTSEACLACPGTPDRMQETTVSGAYASYGARFLLLQKPDGGIGRTDTVHSIAGMRGGTHILGIYTLLSTAYPLSIPGTAPRWRTVSEMLPMDLSFSLP